MRIGQTQLSNISQLQPLIETYDAEVKRLCAEVEVLIGVPLTNRNFANFVFESGRRRELAELANQFYDKDWTLYSLRMMQSVANGDLMKIKHLQRIMDLNNEELPDFLYEQIKNKLVATVSEVDEFDPKELLDNQELSVVDVFNIFDALEVFLEILEQKGYDKKFIDEKRSIALEKRKIVLSF